MKKKRVLLMALGATALVLVVPGGALARHNGHHHHRASTRARVHHGKVRVLHFGPSNPMGTTGPTGPIGPTGPGPNDAGTVASFDTTTGVLTIALTNGSSVSGMVTGQTEIECQAPRTEDMGDGGGDQQDAQQDGSGDNGQVQAHASDNHGGGESDDQGEGEGQQSCDSSALVQGAVVHEAELDISSAGAAFRSIQLVK
jgi:hypothetical protein